MKRLYKLLLGSLAGLLLIWIFLVTLIYQTPAAWLVYQAQAGIFSGYLPSEAHKLVQQLDVQAVQGRLGQGRIEALTLQGIDIQELHWSLSPWRLALLHPAIQVQLGAGPLPWKLDLALSPGGSLQLGLEPGSLEVIQGQALPLALQGRLEGRLNLKASLQQGQLSCQQLDGHWQGVVRLTQPMTIDLGRVQLEPECTSPQQLSWQLTSTISGEHHLNMSGEAGLDAWQFTAQAEVSEKAELGSLLRMLGWRDQGAIRDGELAPGQRLEARGGGRF